MATEQHHTLKARGYLNGVVVRPSGSDDEKYWPPEGVEVPWVVCRPVHEMLVQAKALEWRNLGAIGNTAHLRRHGDHTPWSYVDGWGAKIRNIVYAKDTEDPSYVEKHLLALCRMDAYDTTWIHFFNVNNRQYNYAGEYQSYSADAHLHVSARRGAWDRDHTLFYDVYRHYKGWPLLNGKRVDNPLAPPEEGIIVADRDDVHVLWNTDNVVRAPDEALKATPDNTHWTPANILRAVYDNAVLHRAEDAANSAALLAALQKHAEAGCQCSMDDIKAAAKEGAQEALADVQITLDWSTDAPAA